MVRVIQDPINSFQLENVNYNFSLLFSYVRALSGGQDITALVQSVEQALQTAQSLNTQGQELIDELSPLLTQLNNELEKVGELKFSGEWNTSNNYKTLNIVSYNGGSFVAKRDNSNVIPVEGDDWGLISQRGDQGIQGPQGEPGRGLIILGLLPNVGSLPSTAQPGDAYIIENTPNNELYVWVSGSFVNMGPFGSGSGITKATTAEAIAGTNDENYITPLTARAAIKNITDIIETNLDNHVNNYLAHGISATTTGTANNYVINPAVPLSSYQRNLKVTLFVNIQNTGASTLNISSLGAKSLKKNDGTNFVSGELKVDTPYTFVYNGTDFFADSAGGGGEEVLLEFEDFYNQETTPVKVSPTNGLYNSVYYNAAGSTANHALFAGGATSATGVVGSVTAYNINNARTSPMNLTIARSRLSASSINGKVLFAGGSVNGDAGTATYNTVDMYDAELNRTTAGNLSSYRFYMTSCNLGDIAFFAGGYLTSNTFSSSVDTYNVDGVRTTISPLTSVKGLCSCASVGDYALIAGGYGGSANGYSNVVDVYDRNLVKLSNAATLMEGKYQMVGITTPKCAIFAGGNSPGMGVFNTLEVYNKELTKSNPNTLNSNKTAGSGASINDGFIYAGGDNGSTQNNVVEHFNYSFVRTLLTNLTVSVRNSSSTNLQDNVFVGGGYNNTGSLTPTNSVQVYNQELSSKLFVTQGSEYAINGSPSVIADSNKSLFYNEKVNGYVKIKSGKFIGGI